VQSHTLKMKLVNCDRPTDRPTLLRSIKFIIDAVWTNLQLKEKLGQWKPDYWDLLFWSVNPAGRPAVFTSLLTNQQVPIIARSTDHAISTSIFTAQCIQYMPNDYYKFRHT
jgi:hypothetical protein